MKTEKRWKILIVNKFLHPNGGSETYIFEIGKALHAMGHEVQFFGMEHPDRIVGNHAGRYTAPMDFHGSLLEKLSYPFSIIYSREAAKKIRAVLNDFQPDVVHLNNFNFQITPSVIYAIKSWAKRNHTSVPLIYTAHDYQWVCPNHMMLIPSTGEQCFQCRGGRYFHCVKNRCIHNSRIKSIFGWLEASFYKRLKVYRHVDRIICPSEFMKEKLATDRLLADRLITVYNFLSGGRTEHESKKEYVLYFGRYTEEKGVVTLLEACRSLSDIPFIFAGKGALEEQITGMDHIKNVGFVKGNDLERLIAEARFSIFPSQWYENCPFSVMESQSCGTPVVAADIGGVPELIRDGVTGDLFRPGDAKELAAKIQSLWTDRERCERYSQNCLAVRFDTVEEYSRQLLEIYKNTASSPIN